jgi:hypothetical protein
VSYWLFRSGNGAVLLDPATWRAKLELRHHALGAFVVDAQVERHATIGFT